MAPTTPIISYGAAGAAAFSTEALSEIFSTLEKHNVKALDTARIYPKSEATLGKAQAPKRFEISTKAPGFSAGGMQKQKLLDGVDESLKDLGVDQVDIYYLHAPDPQTPIEETLEAIREIHAAGKFKRFGISNFLPADVRKIHSIQASHGAVLPTVYQGNYNAVSRHIESSLFPVLRELGISFYAYSPIAGGFLVKDSGNLRRKEDEGRFGKSTMAGDMYTSMYGKESLFQAVDEWGVIAKEAGVSKAALAYRWIAFHSALKADKGDGLIVGASKVAQLEESLKAIDDGPLEGWVAERVDKVWKLVEEEAPLDNWNSFAIKGSTT